jgi:hypothetical protein
LVAVSSTVYFKMKYHAMKNMVTILDEDIKVARRCFLTVNINQSSVSVPKTPYISKDNKTIVSKTEANHVDQLDSSFNKIEMKE